MSKIQDSGKLKVIVRFRPLNEKELQSGSSTCIDSLDGNSIKLKESSNLPSVMNTRFSFDKIFDQTATQKDVYNLVGKNIINSVFQGINGTIFAYGQTSSGKTYTCLGSNIDQQQSRGLIPRIIDDIFHQIRISPACIEYRLKVSLVEIYMQKIQDLLDSGKCDLKIRESKTRGIYIQNATEIYVSSAQQLIKYVKIANANRTLEQTFMNQASSRSHMVFILTLYQNNLYEISAKSAKLTLIDLAGSEKVGKTGAEGKLLDQAKRINKSLSALGNVINALTQAKISHIPYRDSKLTRILQQSLGGNAKTNLIINCSPSQSNEWQTISSLRFGFRAKNIKNKPIINRQYTVAELLLLLEKSERKIEQQQKLLQQVKAGGSIKLLEIPEEQRNLSHTKEEIQLNSDESDQNLLDDLGQIEYSLSTNNIAQLSSKRKKKNSQSIQKILIPDFRQKVLLEERLSALTKTLEKQNAQKFQMTRAHEILRQKHEKLKVLYSDIKNKSILLQRQNQHLVESAVSLETENKELNEKCKEYEERILMYQQGLKNMINEADAMKKQTQKFNLFKYNNEKIETTQKLMQITSRQSQTILKHTKSNSDLGTQLVSKRRLEKIAEEELLLDIDDQKENVKSCKFENSILFEEKQRITSQINTRNQKLKQLQQRFEKLQSKKKALEQTINMEENRKAKRILSLENYLVELSTSYYILKSQQYRWKTDSSIHQNQIRRKSQRIMYLQTELSKIKQNLYRLKIRYEQLAISKSKDTDISDIDFSESYSPNVMEHEPNIVKILKSSTERLNQLMQENE